MPMVSATIALTQTVATLIIPSAFSVTVDQPLNQGPTSFDYAAAEAPGAPTLTGTLDYTNSGTMVPTGITVRGTITWITDSPRAGVNQFDSLSLDTPVPWEKVPAPTNRRWRQSRFRVPCHPLPVLAREPAEWPVFGSKLPATSDGTFHRFDARIRERERRPVVDQRAWPHRRRGQRPDLHA